MNLLAIETATNVCSVAVAQSGRLRAEISLSRPRAHAEHLVPMIQDALRYADVRADKLQVVAVSSGPGSYTGLRIGVSTAKGLAEAVEAALVGVPTLMGLAAQIQTVPGEYVAAAIDARRDEWYAALFVADEDGFLREEREAGVVGSEEILEWFGNVIPPVRLVGSGWAKLIDALREAQIPFRYANTVGPSARSIAALGAAKAMHNEFEDLITFEPYYLKEFVARKPDASAFEKLPL